MDFDQDMFDEISDIIILNDENGNEVKFEFLDLIEYENCNYVVLLPVLEDGDEDDGSVLILKVDEGDEDSETESYLAVDSEEDLQAVFAIFKEKFKDEFYFTDEEDAQA